MSDEILSTLGFDASAAISTLKKLGKELENLDGSAGKAAQGLAAFNPISAKTGSALQKLASDADAATKAIQSLAGAAKSLPTTVNAPTLTSGGSPVARWRRWRRGRWQCRCQCGTDRGHDRPDSIEVRRTPEGRIGLQ